MHGTLVSDDDYQKWEIFWGNRGWILLHIWRSGQQIPRLYYLTKVKPLVGKDGNYYNEHMKFIPTDEKKFTLEFSAIFPSMREIPNVHKSRGIEQPSFAREWHGTRTRK